MLVDFRDITRGHGYPRQHNPRRHSIAAEPDNRGHGRDLALFERALRGNSLDDLSSEKGLSDRATEINRGHDRDPGAARKSR